MEADQNQKKGDERQRDRAPTAMQYAPVQEQRHDRFGTRICLVAWSMSLGAVITAVRGCWPMSVDRLLTEGGHAYFKQLFPCRLVWLFCGAGLVAAGFGLVVSPKHWRT